MPFCIIPLDLLRGVIFLYKVFLSSKVKTLETSTVGRHGMHEAIARAVMPALADCSCQH